MFEETEKRPSLSLSFILFFDTPFFPRSISSEEKKNKNKKRKAENVLPTLRLALIK